MNDFFTNNINNAWILPVVKWALDNKCLTTRSNFSTNNSDAHKIVNHIMTNFYKKTLAEYQLDAKVMKSGTYRYLYFGSNVYQPSSLEESSEYLRPYAYFRHNILNLSSEELNNKPDFIRQLVNNWNEIKIRCNNADISIGSFFYRMRFDINYYLININGGNASSPQSLIDKFNVSKELFSMYKRILTTFQGI